MHCFTHITMNSPEKNMIMVIHQTIGIGFIEYFSEVSLIFSRKITLSLSELNLRFLPLVEITIAQFKAFVSIYVF
jgi:hypothetical protein